ncbi:MAG: carboxypeptidase M32, partial [Candidatus Neomarinimicrobiota bacterium]
MNRRLGIVTSELQVITQLRKVAALMAWDQETYMPSGSAAARSEQISLVLSLAHARFTSDTFRDSL